MGADPLTDVLRLVAEGRLTAEEAAPILAALDERTEPGARPGTPGTTGSAGPRVSPDGGATTGASTSLRLEIREGGHSVVNLRLPIAVGRLALDKVPGLSGDQVDRVRDALASGVRGPILEVEDGDSTVRILVE